MSDSEGAAISKALERSHDAAARQLQEEHGILGELERAHRGGMDSEVGQEYEAKRKVRKRRPHHARGSIIVVTTALRCSRMFANQPQ